MRTAPEDLVERDLVACLAEGWGLDLVDAEYLPVGFGSHHWLAIDAGGGRHFVTVDDLDRRRDLGATRESALARLRCGFNTALALRRHGSLDFVIAPVPTPEGDTVRRISNQHTIAVFPFVEGSSAQFGGDFMPGERADVVDLLVRLHCATPSAASVARPASVALIGRGDLESALRDLGRKWTGGPYSEPARALLAARAARVRRLLLTFDRLADHVVAMGAERVITHGEPHAANVVRAGRRLLLVDWDTAGLALPERDLWLVDAGSGDEVRRYAEASGRAVDEAAIRLYSVRWTLADLAVYLRWFRSAHRRTADTEKAWLGLASSLESDDLYRRVGG